MYWTVRRRLKARLAAVGVWRIFRPIAQSRPIQNLRSGSEPVQCLFVYLIKYVQGKSMNSECEYARYSIPMS